MSNEPNMEWRIERSGPSMGPATIHVVDAKGAAIFDAISSPVSDAKAHLIVAAPKMLAALRLMLEDTKESADPQECFTPENLATCTHFRCVARRAIAMAEGKVS